MPRGDRTGPRGMGPMTGRARGFCADYNHPGFMSFGPGRGHGRGFGRGWGIGRGRGFGMRASAGWGYPYGMPPYMADYPELTPDEEQKQIKHEKELLQQQLDFLTERMNELEKKK